MTKKYVLTGGPGIGKTTVLEILAARGYDTIPEAARAVIETEQAADGDALPWKDGVKFQKKVADLQLGLEKRVSQELAFLDRGLVDGAGYCAYFGNPTPEEIGIFGYYRYEKVFLLDRLPIYENDSARLEDPKQAGEIHEAVREAYVRFGYEPITVPVLPPHDRVEFILARL